MKKLKNTKLSFTHILSFFLGVFCTALINNIVEGYLNRPKVSTSIDCLNFFINEDNEFILEIYLKHYNTGKSATSISLKQLDLQLSGVNQKELQFDFDKSIQIDALSSVYDTLRFSLPSHMDTISNIPSISCLRIVGKEFSQNKIITTTVDSSNVIYSSIMGIKVPSNPSSYSFDSDYVVKDGLSKVIFRKVPIVYKGKTYMNCLYPRDASYSYRQENGRILVKCNCPFKINADSFTLIKPIIFLPAKEIEDIVDVADGYQLCTSYEVNEGNKSVIRNYQVDVKNYSKQIIYFLKK